MTTNSHDFPCDGPIDADVQLGAGTVQVTAGDGLTATVTVSPDDSRETSRVAAQNTTVDFDHGKLVVRAQKSEGWSILRGGGQVRIELVLPLDSNLTLKMGSADLRTAGRLRNVEVKTGSGDLVLAETSGTVNVESGSGDVRATVVGGDLKVRTASGDVTATRVAGAATISGASADISLEDVLGPVSLNTASGDVRIGAVRGSELHVKSASGDVAVGVPVGTRVWLDLSTMSGSTNSDLDMTGQASADGPTTTLQVRTMSGDIRIRRVGATHHAAA
jgi:Toastrack DUF4097